MSDLEKVKELNVNDLIKGLTESQTVMNYAFAGFKTETEKRFEEINERIGTHDKILEKRVYITSGKARTLQEKVKEKVKDVCKENKLDYHKCKSKVFPRVWSKIKAKYDVANYRELPEIFWQEILEYLRDMTINIKDITEEEEENVLCKN